MTSTNLPGAGHVSDTVAGSASGPGPAAGPLRGDVSGHGSRSSAGDGYVGAGMASETPIPDWMEERFAVLRSGAVTAAVRDDFREYFGRYDLMQAADRPPDAPGVGAAGGGEGAGRGVVYHLPVGKLGQAVLRPYRRGGLIRHLVDRRYFWGDRAFDELALTERLRRLELPVPEPLAAVQRDLSPGYRAALVTRRIPGVRPLPELLEDGIRDPDELMAAAGRTVGRLHREGVWHADLNAFNLLADPTGGPVHVVDFDRGRFFDDAVTGFFARSNRKRLRTSLEKLELDAAREAWPAFEAACRDELQGAESGDGS